MKMRNLLLGLTLGLLAVVHSTAVNTVTQNPAKPDEAFLKDAMTEGFIVGPPPTLTTESPKRNTTVQASQQPIVNSEDLTEGSAAGETTDIPAISSLPYTTIPPSTSHAYTFESKDSSMIEGSAAGETSDELTTPFTLDTTASLSVSYAPTSDSIESSVFEGSTEGETTTSVPSEVRSSITSNYVVISQTTDPAVSSSEYLSILSSSSGSVQEEGPIKAMNSTVTLTSATENKPRGRMFGGIGSDWELQSPAEATPLQQNGQQENKESEQRHKGHVTPDWIIILGFIVGLTALVMLCVAIATRHKWNAPNQASQTISKNNSSNQQREQEMETFLHNGEPKENGKAAEYTVIPLDELPEHDPSQ